MSVVYGCADGGGVCLYCSRREGGRNCAPRPGYRSALYAAISGWIVPYLMHRNSVIVNINTEFERLCAFRRHKSCRRCRSDAVKLLSTYSGMEHI